MWLKRFCVQDWVDDTPEKFLSKEQLEARRNKPERVYHAPTIIKCFNMWEDESSKTMTFITELLNPGQVGAPSIRRRAFTCLQLGNYNPPRPKSGV